MTFRLHACRLGAALLLMAALPAFAQTPAAPAKPATKPAPAATPAAPAAPPPAAAPVPTLPVGATDETRKLVVALIDKIGIKNQVSALMANVRGQFAIGLARANGKKPEDMLPVVDEILMPDFLARANELVSGYIEVWAANFTADDLKALAEFYATPAGEKLIKTVPTIQRQSLGYAQAWMNYVNQGVLKAHEDELKKRGLKY